MKWMYAFAGVACALLGLATHASAITFSYTGSLTQVAALDPENPFPIEPDFGTPFSGTYTFNGTAADGIPADPATGSYISNGAPYQLTFSVAGRSFTYGGVALGVTNGDSSIGFGSDEYLFGFTQAGAPTPMISARITDPTGTMFGNDHLPLTPVPLPAPEFTFFMFSDIVDGNQVELEGVLTSLTCREGCATAVPQPLTVTLLAAGLGVLALRHIRTIRRRDEMTLRAITTRSSLLAALLIVGLASSAHAVDGVVLIDQNRALAGGVTPGDAPGFPISINTPGIYKLGSNLVVPNENTTAIMVNVDNVTIDLNGFAILGPNVCFADGTHVAQPCTRPGTGYGIDAGTGNPALVNNTRVSNGTIDGVGFIGVFANVNARIERMNISNSGSSGIYTFGGVIIDTLVRGNGDTGIVTTGAVITGTRSVFNRGYGIQTGNASILSGNVVQTNLSYGLVLTANTRYVDNVVGDNNGGSGNPQISGGTQAGVNTCGTTACP
jgi:hypothetical protein